MINRSIRLSLLLCTLFFFPLSAYNAKEIKLGVICALPKEIGALTEELSSPVSSETVAMRQYVSGNLWGVNTVLTTSRVGKVAASATTTHLIESEQVDAIVYLGVAGAIDQRLHQGDVVVGESLIQYDLDSRPIIPQFVIPLLNISQIHSDPSLLALAVQAAEDYLSQGSTPSNQVYTGLIGTGDRFISASSEKDELRKSIPSILAVDMEGAAVAQVCYEHGVPFVVIRTISDSCDDNAALDCMAFLNKVAPIYTREILHRFYSKIGSSH